MLILPNKHEIRVQECVRRMPRSPVLERMANRKNFVVVFNADYAAGNKDNAKDTVTPRNCFLKGVVTENFHRLTVV